MSHFYKKKTVIYSGWNCDVKRSSSVWMGVDSANTSNAQRMRMNSFLFITVMRPNRITVHSNTVHFIKSGNQHNSNSQTATQTDYRIIQGHSDAHPTALSLKAIINITPFPVKQYSLFNRFQGTQRKSVVFWRSHIWMLKQYRAITCREERYTQLCTVKLNCH